MWRGYSPPQPTIGSGPSGGPGAQLPVGGQGEGQGAKARYCTTNVTGSTSPTGCY